MIFQKLFLFLRFFIFLYYIFMGFTILFYDFWLFLTFLKKIIDSFPYYTHGVNRVFLFFFVHFAILDGMFECRTQCSICESTAKKTLKCIECLSLAFFLPKQIFADFYPPCRPIEWTIMLCIVWDYSRQIQHFVIQFTSK